MSTPENQRLLELAVERHQAGRLAEAEQLYREVLGREPGNANAWHLLGVLAGQVQEYDAAIELIGRAIQIAPNHAIFYSNFGQYHWRAGHLNEAMAACRQAIALEPGFADAHNTLGAALYAAGQLDEAVAAYGQALALNPDFADALNNLGTALQASGQLDQAIAAYRRVLQLNPNLADTYSNLGTALCANGQLDQAIAAFGPALALKPGAAEIHNNLGNALKDQGQLDQAIAAFGQAIALKADFAEAHWNLAFALLLQGQFLPGWEEYEWRWKWKNFPSPRRDFAQAQWDGQPLEGRTLLLHAEQGIGDTLQFVRYLPLVAQRGGHIILECQPPLQRLLQPIAGQCLVVAQGQPLPAFDVHCPLMSLPRLFRTTLDSIPRDVPYVHADADDIQIWRDRLAKAGDRGQGTGDRKGNLLYVGLAWAGNPGNKNNRTRSVPLARLAPLAQVHGIRFVSLQKGEPAAQAKGAPAGMDLIDLSQHLSDFADTAALIANLDLVIAVDTAVVHLAGAMGKPVWVLLSFAADWRWLLVREDTPWYPSMRLFRQPAPGDWDSVIAPVVDALAAFTA